jgi:hypothetical protein
MNDYHLSVQNHRDMHDAGFTELICPHGIGHHKGIHGCDGVAGKVGYSSTEDWLGVITGVVTRYDLRKDDITEQSDECVAYLAQLLG